MTFVEDFNQDNEPDLLEEESNYPVAFGITFTPQVTGIALGLLGLVGAAYVLLNFVLPANEAYQKLKADEKAKQEQVEIQKSGALAQKLTDAEARFKEAGSLRSQVLNLFSSDKSLQTLLIDVDKLVKARGITLTSFAPTGDVTVVSDGSLGETVNNKLKRQSFSLSVEGNYEKTHGLLRDLERLQPLLIIKGLNSVYQGSSFTLDLVDAKVSKGQIQAKGKVIPKNDEKIKSTFSLDAILPLSPEELAKLAPPPPAATEGDQKATEGEQKPPEKK